MKRTTRNVLAITGMAGGLFFLGQAVASADDGAGNVNDSNNQSTATNTNTTTVTTNVAGGSGGTNGASVNTGATNGGGGIAPNPNSVASSSGGGGGGGGGAEVETGDVKVSQEANGGSVSNSGNVSVSGGPTQTATATADTTVHQSATSKGGGNSEAPAFSSSSMGGGGAGNLNHSNNQSEASNYNSTTVTTNAYGGDGGRNYADVNTGLILDYGIRVLDAIAAESSGPAGWYGGFEVDTGDVRLSQEANGGDVHNSGNVSIRGGAHQTATADADTDVYQRSRSRGYDGGGAGNFNGSNNQSEASNYNSTTVTTNAYGGRGGENFAGVNTGALLFFGLFGLSSPSEGYDGGGVEVETGDVWLKQEANGGDVRNSGNVSIWGGPRQTATAHADTDVHQTARSRGGDWAWNLNWSNNQASASNSNYTTVTTNAYGGDAGSNEAEVNTGLLVFFGYIPTLSSSGAEYDEGGFEVETGDVWLKQEANGGDVRNSGNVSIHGGARQTATAHADTDVHQKARAKGSWLHYCRAAV